MYFADPAQSHTAKKGFELSIVLLQQKRQAGLVSSIEACACSEQKEQANTLCLYEILGYFICSQWFFERDGFHNIRKTSMTALPSLILSPSFTLYPLQFRGTIRHSGSLSVSRRRLLMKKCPSLRSTLMSGRQFSNLFCFFLSFPSRNANQQFSSFLSSVPEALTIIF